MFLFKIALVYILTFKKKNIYIFALYFYPTESLNNTQLNLILDESVLLQKIFILPIYQPFIYFAKLYSVCQLITI